MADCELRTMVRKGAEERVGVAALVMVVVLEEVERVAKLVASVAVA